MMGSSAGGIIPGTAGCIGRLAVTASAARRPLTKVHIVIAALVFAAYTVDAIGDRTSPHGALKTVPGAQSRIFHAAIPDGAHHGGISGSSQSKQIATGGTGAGGDAGSSNGGIGGGDAVAAAVDTARTLLHGRRLLAATVRASASTMQQGYAAAAAAAAAEEAVASVAARADGAAVARQGLAVAQGRGRSIRSFWAQQVAVMVLVLASVGMVWLKRLLSCACMRPPADGPAAGAPDTSRAGASRSVRNNNSTPMSCSSQNHTLVALSRFSAQLRMGRSGDLDGSVRGGLQEGSRLGPSMLRTNGEGSTRGGGGEGSVRGGGGGGGGVRPQPQLQPPPALLSELSEMQRSGMKGRLATVLQGVWNGQHRSLIKVLLHGEDCSFMLEQVGEVWTRMMHPNIVACYAAETFPVTALATVPTVAGLLPPQLDTASTYPSADDPGALTLQTWFVLERCENGSLAVLLSQRYTQMQQQLAGHGQGGVAAAAAPSVRGGGGKERLSPARLLAKKLGRLSRGSRRKSAKTVPEDAAAAVASASALAVVVVTATAGPMADGEEPTAAGLAGTSGSDAAGSSAVDDGSGQEESASPSAVIIEAAAAAAAAATCALEVTAGNGSSGAGSPGTDAGGAASGSALNGGAVETVAAVAEGSANSESGPLPGLLPVVETLSIAVDVASGLAYLHSLDLCHGDLRPENVLVQTLVLPGSSRMAAGGGGGGGGGGGAIASSVPPGTGGDGAARGEVSADGSGSGVGGATMPGGGGDGGGGSGAGGGGGRSRGRGARASCDAGEREHNDLLYGSCSAQSDMTDFCTAAGGGGGGGAHGRASTPFSNLSTIQSGSASAAAADSGSNTVWSSSLRQSTGFMMTSSSNNTASMPPHTAAGSAQSNSNGLASQCYFNRVSGGSGRVAVQYGLGSGRSQLGAAAVAAVTLAGGGGATLRVPPMTSLAEAGGDVDGGGGGDGGAPSPFTLSTSAVAALSRGAGGGAAGVGSSRNSLQASLASAGTSLGQANGGGAAAGMVGFTRRTSGGSLSAFNTASGGDMSAASRALAGLTAWPESPPPDGSRHGGGGGAAAPAAPLPAAGTFPARRVGRPVAMGGLKSALSGSLSPGGPRTTPVGAPEAAAFPAGMGGGVPSPQHRTQSAFVQAPAQVPSTLYTGSSQQRDGSCEPSAATAAIRAPLTSIRLPGDADAGSFVSAAAIAARYADSPGGSAQPSPRGGVAGSLPPGSGGADSGPSSSSAATTPAAAAAAAAAAMPMGHMGRRCAPSPVVCLPVIRRVAKLSDPWLSLARLPPEWAGGAWSPEAAAAVGAAAGSDVAHLPPELLLSGRLHPSSDVYSLGMLMWRMLSSSGEAPYAKMKPAEVAYKVAACGMRPAFSPAVPEPLRRLVEDMWQSDPAARPTVQQVLRRLAELQAAAPALQRQWRERHALFGAVATVPITAVATVPLHGESVGVAARWADAAGIRQPRTSWVGSRGGIDVSGAGGAGSNLFNRTSSRGVGVTGGLSSALNTGNASSFQFSGSAAHLYAQQPPSVGTGGHLHSFFPSGPNTGSNTGNAAATVQSGFADLSNYTATSSRSHNAVVSSAAPPPPPPQQQHQHYHAQPYQQQHDQNHHIRGDQAAVQHRANSDNQAARPHTASHGGPPQPYGRRSTAAAAAVVLDPF